jgi:hypothetical protein
MNQSTYQIGNTIVVQEVITKTKHGNHIKVMAKTSKVLSSAPLEVDQSKFSEGEDLIRHRQAESLKIAQALTEPLKKKVSIMGRMVQVRLCNLSYLKTLYTK